VFSILILIHEAGHLVAAKRAGIRVEAFSLGMGKRLIGKKIGETDYRLSIIPFGGFCQMSGENQLESKGEKDEFVSKSIGSRFWVIAAGSLTNYIFAFILFSVIFMIGSPTLSNEVGDVLKGLPADNAGIKKGDRILYINQKEIEYWDDIVSEVRGFGKKDGSLKIDIARGDTSIELSLVPEISVVTNIFGQKISTPLIGIAPRNKILAVSYNPLEAFYHGGKKLIYLTAMTYKGIWLLITGGMPVKASVSGPVGIASLIMKAADTGLVHLLIITAHISMALAIFNLLPFPVLDGGHIIFLAIEKLKGRPVSIRTQEVVTNIALFLLIGFALFVTYNDVIKLIPTGK
jgi:regulator of sigma E protease